MAQADPYLRLATNDGPNFSAFSFDHLRTSAQAITQASSLVNICWGAIPNYTTELGLDGSKTSFADEIWFADSTLGAAAFVLVVNCLNFGSGYFPYIKKNASDSGYKTVASALLKHFEQYWPFLPSDLCHLDAIMFLTPPAEGPSPEFKELAALFSLALQELGSTINERFKNSFECFIESAESNPTNMVATAMEMQCYRDGYRYLGLDFMPAKKAQITVSDLISLGEYLGSLGHDTGLLSFDNCTDLTAFCDNSVPHVLSRDGILDYDQALRNHLEQGKLIDYGSQAEIEIRAATLVAVDAIAGCASEIYKSVVSAREVDAALWNKKHHPNNRAHYRAILSHKCRSLYY